MIGLRHIVDVFIVISVSAISDTSQVDNLRYVGCYDAGYSLRHKYHHHITSVTLTKCVQYCHDHESQFAAVEVRYNFCYCGGDIAEMPVQSNSTLCNAPCPDDPLRTCGGDWLMSLYHIQGATGEVSAISDSSQVDNLRYVGCYDSGYSLRHKYHRYISSVTLTKCVQYCQKLKTRFAAVEDSNNFCYCGNDIAEESIQRNTTRCNVPCSDDPLRTCGGDGLMSLYEGYAVDDANFLIAITARVRLLNSGETSTFNNLMTTPWYLDWVVSVDYHFSKNLIFAHSEKMILKAALKPRTRTLATTLEGQLVKNVTVCYGLAVDWVHDRLYVPYCASNGTSIISFGLEGEDEKTVLYLPELTGRILSKIEIDPYKGIVFWSVDRIIQSVETSGEGFNPSVLKAKESWRSSTMRFTLERRQQRVYYADTEDESTSLYSVDYSGGGQVEHFSVPQFSYVNELYILGDKVFWVKYTLLEDVIYEAPLNLTNQGDVKIIRKIGTNVHHMRLVHPSVQGQPKIDPCLDKGCAHSCVASGVITAKCKCPPGQALHDDGVSCHTISGSSQVDNLRYVGCYDAGYALRQKYHHLITSVTLTKCVQYCQELETRYAAVEASGNFCYCGGDIAQFSIQRNTTRCNVPCPDDPLRTCGGDWLMSLYDIQGASGEDAIPDVDVLVGISKGVRLYKSGDNSNYGTLKTTEAWVDAVGYHFSKNLVFANSLTFFKISLKPQPQWTTLEVQVLRNYSMCDGFAVDWVHDLIYRANCDSHETSIVTFGLDGESERTLLSRTELNEQLWNIMEIDPYKGIVFWASDKVIQSVETSGEGFNTNVTQTNVFVRAVALDLKLRRVYYVGYKDHSASLYSMDYSGGEMVQLFSVPQFDGVLGLSILGDKVFWMDYAMDLRNVVVVYMAPLNLTQVEDVKVIKTIDELSLHMKVVHPSLQRRPKIDPCLDKDCAHSCVASGATTAKCKCPPGQTLNDDGVSCHTLVGQDGRTAAPEASLAQSKLLDTPYSRSH